MAGRYYIVFIALCNIAWHCNGGITSSYVRKHRPPVCMPMEAMPPPPGDNTPEQVHITQGDYVGRSMIVSWVTPLEKYPNEVFYWEADGKDKDKHSARATINFYRYYNYSSGYIHHATLGILKYDTKYFYQIGSRRFFFTTPPEVGPDVPYTFGIMGDLGQTFDSNQTFLFAGDLSYADDHPFHDNSRWDSWGRFVEKSAAYQPWIWAAGNHELDFAPELGENRPFKPYMHRYHTPYKASNSTSPLWYSIKRASAHIIVLSSHSAYGKYTPQYQWLKEELPKVNRSETPWLIVVVHSPWYNSDNYHYMEGESMRVMFEPWPVEHKADVVFAGHVHAYERTYRVSNVKYNITNRLCAPTRDMSAPMYITIGDGGNIEGLADMYTDPQPEYSAFREASFGHAILEIKNRTHAHYTWHRNHDNEYRVSNVMYNITNRLCTPTRDINAPMYITIGDGGNIEGLADMYTDPQPEYSAFREASFGHAILEIKNRTHAHYTWHRNHDNEPVTTDSTWLYNRYWYPQEDDA